ncbi:MAG: TadE/TadG family type IV pilus assembly protein [Firmicutes bacterium]|nr:TadE/TadG family type IV pilus assembly protein [Bacillota bacterium]MDD4708384.1 TadE/TadG family type IV pilus assembly protein [Bacillota bacterium]
MFKRFRRNDKGQALVEFSVSLPVLLLLVAGILEFSRLGGTLLMVNYGAREGARAAALGANDSAIIEQIKQSTLLLDDAKLVVDIDPEVERTSSQNVSVTVQYPVDINIPIINKITGTPKWVTGSLTMRVE